MADPNREVNLSSDEDSIVLEEDEEEVVDIPDGPSTAGPIILPPKKRKRSETKGI